MLLRDVLLGWFIGNEDAADFCMEVFEASQQWDDLVDEGECDVNALLAWLAFGKEYNAFFRKHPDILRPALLVMFLQWTAANTLDREPEHIHKAYMLRAGVYSIFHLVAWIVGGTDHAEKIGPEIYRHYGETLSGLREEMGCPIQ